MPFAEVLTLEVGSAIAKYILKLWMKDTSLASNISLSIVDVIKNKTSDALAQRRGQRQFDVIGEKVAESLFSLFEVEGASLDEGSRKVVASTVAETLNTAHLSTELLVYNNLEPAKLAKHLIASNPNATLQFSEVETALYFRIIKETCEYIVDIASQLPVFTIISPRS